ncbi:MAG: hypothetical protein H0U95_06565 [Bacteroidetes bacterium]|nr:hypothetical protein [Bacteroidota bacterium]
MIKRCCFSGANTTATSTAWSVTADNLRKIYVTGRTQGNLNLLGVNSGSVYSKTSTLGQVDSYIISFNAQNSLIWNTYYGGQYNECATELDFNPIEL